MKLQIHLLSKNIIHLPVHYNHLLQAMLLKSIDDEQYRTFIHDQGYHYEKRQFKLFTFSKLNGKYKLSMDRKFIDFEKEIMLIVSSSQESFIKQLEQGIKTKTIRLGSNELQVTKLIVKEESLIVKEESLVGDYLKVRTLSPVVAYSTIIEAGKKKTLYYTPQDEQFSKVLRENIIKKYKSIYGERPLQNEDFEVLAIATEKYQKSVVYYKNFIINGYSGNYVLLGNPVLIQFALEAGLGGKNAQGFGCVEAK